MYSNSTEKQLKDYLDLYSGLLISCVVLPIIFTIVSYYLNGRANFSYIKIFIIVITWSIINVYYLRNLLKSKKTK